ncbi:MAG: mandelate racemase/muconate lactonizing enzyme family protein [Lachnospiraceae bacterium]|nr:mandelate racemase/muconate lactonizing enzyme family protein [Lachnospiraceae bacterium]
MSQKIAKIETFLFYPGTAKNLLLCKITTDDGVYGWGEAYVQPRKEMIPKMLIDLVAPSLVGRSVFEIRHIRDGILKDFNIKRTSIEIMSAISGIEIAMWDIVGKYAGQPVVNLLGGPYRSAIRCYANGWWKGNPSDEELAARAVRLKEQGWSAVKWDPFRGPWREYVSEKFIDRAVENVRVIREAVGPDMELMVEGHRRLSPYNAIHFYDKIAQYNPSLYEEPCCSDNLDLVVQAKQGIHVPVVTGETMHSKGEFKEVFEKHAAEIINPDTCATGGISAMMEIAHMADPYAVILSPHNYNSTVVGLAATVHLSAAVPNFNIAEVFVNIKPGCDSIASKNIVVKDGFAEIPTEPGLGIDIDVEALEKQAFREVSAAYNSPSVLVEYPCKEDYPVLD